MTISTKFDVHNLVKRKFDREDQNINMLEVMEVISQSCYAATQVFYLCKIIRAHRFRDQPWKIEHGIGRDDNATGWRKYREDELIEATKQEIDIVLGMEAKTETD